MTAAIEARNLTKFYRSRGAGLIRRGRDIQPAVADLSFRIERGELVALLGPNGAGKSTTIKLLCGILTPSRGDVFVDGRIPHRDRTANAHSVGAVFGHKTQLWWDLPARYSFELLRDIFDVAADSYAERIDEFDAVLELRQFWNAPVRNLSLGQRVRCEVAAAMLHDPPVVFLDEPTIGMDVMAKQKLREFLRSQVSQRGRTMVLTTHDMSDVARLCERVLLLMEGRLAFDGPLQQLGHSHERDLEDTIRDVYRTVPPWNDCGPGNENSTDEG